MCCYTSYHSELQRDISSHKSLCIWDFPGGTSTQSGPYEREKGGGHFLLGFLPSALPLDRGLPPWVSPPYFLVASWWLLRKPGPMPWSMMFHPKMKVEDWFCLSKMLTKTVNGGDAQEFWRRYIRFIVQCNEYKYICMSNSSNFLLSIKLNGNLSEFSADYLKKKRKEPLRNRSLCDFLFVTKLEELKEMGVNVLTKPLLFLSTYLCELIYVVFLIIKRKNRHGSIHNPVYLFISSWTNWEKIAPFSLLRCYTSNKVFKFNDYLLKLVIYISSFD